MITINHPNMDMIFVQKVSVAELERGSTWAEVYVHLGWCVCAVIEGILISCSSTLQYLRVKYMCSRVHGTASAAWQSF